jgi:hypothetical protein
MAGRPTGKIGGGSPTTQPLPRATVKLQPTATPSAPISSVNVRTAALDDEEEVDEGPLNIMGWVALVGAIIAAFFVWATWDKAPGELLAQGVLRHDPNATAAQRDAAIKSWKESPADDGLKLNADYSPFDYKKEDGEIGSTYQKWEPKTPARPADPYGSTSN